MVETFELITFRVGDVEHVLRTGKGKPAETIVAVMTEYAERLNNPMIRKIPVFAELLKSGKLEGTTVINIEEHEYKR